MSSKPVDKRVYFIPDKARVVRHAELNSILAKMTAAEAGRLLGVSKETIYRNALQANLIGRVAYEERKAK